MPRPIRCLLGAPVLAMSISLLATSGAVAAEYVPGEVVVKFERGVDAAERRELREDVNATFDRGLLLPNTQVVQVDGSVPDAVRELEAQDGVAYAEPNYVYRNEAAPPNDPRFGELWGLRNIGQVVDGAKGVPGVDIDALPAWDTTRGAGQIVAVVDGGVAMQHPDLSGRIWTNADEIPSNALDDDQNGFVDDVRGWDFVAGDNSPEDHGTSHGTHVAGTIAATANDGTGVAGVAPEATIMPVAGTGPDGSGSNAGLSNAILYAARNGATVVNGSFGGSAYSKTMEDAIAEAGARNVLVVVAAGNDSDNVDSGDTTYPCAYPQANLICVAALDSDGTLASYSNYGPVSVDVGAPGTSVLSSAITFDTIFSDSFTSLSAWTTAGTNNSWGIEAGRLADSPGGNYLPNTNSTATMTAASSFAGRRNCRAGFTQQRTLEADVDRLNLRIVSGGTTSMYYYTGSTTGSTADLPLVRYATTGSFNFDGNASVRFQFGLTSDGSIEFDGANIDDFVLKCRAETFGAGSYRFMQGTSMATPHVSGAAALIRAANPGLSAAEVAARIRSRTVPTAALQGITTTGGRADAALALTAATVVQPPVVEPPVVPPPPAAPGPAAPPANLGPASDPCRGLTGKRLATCTVERQVVSTCSKVPNAKKATCAKKVRALAACKALPAKGKKAKAKRTACFKKANAIGKPKPKAKGKAKRR